MSDYWYRQLKDKLIEGTEMGKIGDVHINQFAGGKEKGLSVQLTSGKGDGYVQLTKDEAKALAQRLMKWSSSDKPALPGEFESVREAVGDYAEPIYDLIDELGDSSIVLDNLIRYLDGDQIKDFVDDFRRHHDMPKNMDDMDEAEIELEPGYTIKTDKPGIFKGTKTSTGYVGGKGGEVMYKADRILDKIEYEDPATDEQVKELFIKYAGGEDKAVKTKVMKTLRQMGWFASSNESAAIAEKKKNCGCGKDPCETYGVQKENEIEESESSSEYIFLNAEEGGIRVGGPARKLYGWAGNAKDLAELFTKLGVNDNTRIMHSSDVDFASEEGFEDNDAAHEMIDTALVMMQMESKEEKTMEQLDRILSLAGVQVAKKAKAPVEEESQVAESDIDQIADVGKVYPKIKKMKMALIDRGMEPEEAHDKACEKYDVDPDMCDKYIEMMRDSREKVKEDDIEEGSIKYMHSLKAKGKSMEEIAKELDMTVDEVKQAMAKTDESHVQEDDERSGKPMTDETRKDIVEIIRGFDVYNVSYNTIDDLQKLYEALYGGHYGDIDDETADKFEDLQTEFSQLYDKAAGNNMPTDFNSDFPPIPENMQNEAARLRMEMVKLFKKDMKESEVIEEAEDKMPSKSHIMKMCKDGKTKKEICDMHPDCDQGKLKKMIDDCMDEMKEKEEVKEETLEESPTMDTTQLIHLLKLSGVSQEKIDEHISKLDEEWGNTPEGVGETDPTVHGDEDNYNFAQMVNLSLKRYLDAQDMKVTVNEDHTVEGMRAKYDAMKNK